MASVSVLIEGIHEKTADGKLKIGSTISLIKSDKNIIVDTGYLGDEKRIIEALKKENLTSDDIDIVILTHLHLDHTSNTNIFKNALVYSKFTGGNYPGQVHNIKENSFSRFDLNCEPEIAKDVKIITTPGHTSDMISVVVKTDSGIVVVAGDALSSQDFMDLAKEPDPLLCDNVQKFNESRKKIIELADYIIPGHGKIFKVNQN